MVSNPSSQKSFIDNHKVINSRNKSQTSFFKMYLAYGIDKADCTNLPIHSGCLPIFPTIIVHSDDFDFVSRFHGSEVMLFLIFFFDGFLSSHSGHLNHQKGQELFGRRHLCIIAPSRTPLLLRRFAVDVLHPSN